MKGVLQRQGQTGRECIKARRHHCDNVVARATRQNETERFLLNFMSPFSPAALF
jgi:hypothetical protein